MTRISLKEQYDNSSVIKQIVDLFDEVDSVIETAESAKTMATEAGTKADIAKAAADTATTKNTEQDAQIASIQAKDTEQDTAIAGVKATADAALADVTISTDEISATLLLKNSVESETSKAIPLASENATGMMTKATYSGMVALGDRVTALEGKTTVVYVSFTSDEPSQSEITTLFTAQTGKAPIAGNQAIDIERSLTYQYNGSEWIKTVQAISAWTNDTAGIVKGTSAGAENAGTIFAESDGTGSVNGWDDLVARVATNESAISTTIPSIYATKTALDAIDSALAETTSTANDAQNKANGCIDNVTLSTDGKTLTFTKIDDTHIDIGIASGGFDVISFTEPIFLTTSYYSYASTSGSSIAYGIEKWENSIDLMMCDSKPIAVFKEGQNATATWTYTITFNAALVSYLANLVNEKLSLSDGTYNISFLVGTVTSTSFGSINYQYAKATCDTPAKIRFVVADGEITSSAWSNTVKTDLIPNYVFITAISKAITV